MIDLVASPDGARILVLGFESSRVLDASDGRELTSMIGHALAGAIASDGRILRGLRDPNGGSVVQITTADGALVRTIDVTGAAPSTIHAMMTDGECQETFTEAPVHVTSLAAGHGVIAIGGSDGSIRIHRDEPSVAETRLERGDVRRHPGGAVSAIAMSLRGPRELVAVYSDGAIVRWDPTRRARLGQVDGACTADELRRIAVIPGLPGDVEACGGTLHAAIAGDHVALAGSSGLRVRTLGGAALAGVPSLHSVGPVIFDDELWAGGTDAVVERWSLDGLFRGTHRLGTGWANVVALSTELIAVMGAGEGEVHGTESEGVRPTAIWRIADGTRLGGFDDVRGDVRFVGDRVVATLGDGRVVVRRAYDATELASVRASIPRDAGLPEARVAIVRVADGALIVGDRVQLVTADAMRELGPAPPRPDVGVVTEQAASRDGSVLARLVFDATSFSFALEVFALGPTPTLLFRLERVGEHVGVRAEGTQVIVSNRGEEVAHLLEVPSGRELPLPFEGASWVGFDARGRACVHGRDLEATLSCVERDRLVSIGPRLLSMTGAEPVGDRYVAFSLGGGAYVLDGRGRTLAHVGCVEGDGFAITAPEGLLAASAGEHDELFVRVGDRALPLSSSEAPRDVVLGSARWRALVRAR